MNDTEVLALFDIEQRREIEFPGMQKEVLSHVVRFVRPLPGMSFVLYSDLNEQNADAVIDEQVAYFTGQGLTFEWKVYAHDRPADLVDRLIAKGFEAEEQEAVMVLDVQNARILTKPTPGIEIRRLSNPAQLEDVIRVLEPVWGSDFQWVHDRLGSHMVINDYLSVYVAYDGETPVATGWTYFPAGHFASIWGGSTLAAHRGRGIYSALLAIRVEEARQRGVTYLSIDAGTMSKPIVAKYGFETITYATACEWKESQGTDS